MLYMLYGLAGAGAKLKGGYGGMTHPPQLPISQGTEEVCRAKMWFRFPITDCVLFDVDENVDVGRKFFRVYYVRF